ncbi:MAG TPA: YafY family protein [Ferrovibrio sp.]|jgi:predicted DNA-binding transcriptional regulator YafY|uniref:helix-turn-helix transcriptional regulator n=1 Tax=Ferrovibrio sp. TaxID=1917215 RepID=UPI002ED0A8B4
MLSGAAIQDAIPGHFAMRRADRLFQIIQILRRARAPLTGEAIAAELECSLRTVYRDIADLIGQRVPIRGEAGFGYVLEGGYDMPPLMLTPDEIEAAVLGAQWVAGQGDPALARAAQDLIAKIEAAVPEKLRPYLAEPASIVSQSGEPRPPDRIDLAQLRAQIRLGRKLALDYADVEGRTTRRVIWPVTLGFMQTVRIVAAWCELRQDFRHFRTDRVLAAEFLDERYPQRPAVLRAQWRDSLRREMERRKGARTE